MRDAVFASLLAALLIQTACAIGSKRFPSPFSLATSPSKSLADALSASPSSAPQGEVVSTQKSVTTGSPPPASSASTSSAAPPAAVKWVQYDWSKRNDDEITDEEADMEAERALHASSTGGDSEDSAEESDDDDDEESSEESVEASSSSTPSELEGLSEKLMQLHRSLSKAEQQVEKKVLDLVRSNLLGKSKPLHHRQNKNDENKAAKRHSTAAAKDDGSVQNSNIHSLSQKIRVLQAELKASYPSSSSSSPSAAAAPTAASIESPHHRHHRKRFRAMSVGGSAVASVSPTSSSPTPSRAVVANAENPSVLYADGLEIPVSRDAAIDTAGESVRSQMVNALVSHASSAVAASESALKDSAESAGIALAHHTHRFAKPSESSDQSKKTLTSASSSPSPNGASAVVGQTQPASSPAVSASSSSPKAATAGVQAQASSSAATPQAQASSGATAQQAKAPSSATVQKAQASSSAAPQQAQTPSSATPQQAQASSSAAAQPAQASSSATAQPAQAPSSAAAQEAQAPSSAAATASLSTSVSAQVSQSPIFSSKIINPNAVSATSPVSSNSDSVQPASTTASASGAKAEPLELQSGPPKPSVAAPSYLPMDSPRTPPVPQVTAANPTTVLAAAPPTPVLTPSSSSLSAALTSALRPLADASDDPADSATTTDTTTPPSRQPPPTTPTPTPTAAPSPAPANGSAADVSSPSAPVASCSGSPLCPSRTTAEDYKTDPVFTLPDTHPLDVLNALKGITLLRTNLALSRAANAAVAAGGIANLPGQFQNILTKTTVAEMMSELQRAGSGAVSNATGAAANGSKKARIVRSGIWDPKLNKNSNDPCVNPQDCAKLPSSDLMDSVNDQNLPTNQPFKKAHKFRANPISANPNPSKLVKPQYLTRPVYVTNDRNTANGVSALSSSSSLFDSQQKVLSSSLENSFYKYPATLTGQGQFLPVQPKTIDKLQDPNSIVAEADIRSNLEPECGKPKC